MAKKIFIITGEFSGDLHASNVVRELRKINNDVIIEAVGGKNLENAAVKLFSGHDKMSAMGMNLKIILDHFLLGKRIVDYLKNELIFVDNNKIHYLITDPTKEYESDETHEYAYLYKNQYLKHLGLLKKQLKYYADRTLFIKKFQEYLRK